MHPATDNPVGPDPPIAVPDPLEPVDPRLVPIEPASPTGPMPPDAQASAPGGEGGAPTYIELELRGAVDTAVRDGRAVNVAALVADWGQIDGRRGRARRGDLRR